MSLRQFLDGFSNQDSAEIYIVISDIEFGYDNLNDLKDSSEWHGLADKAVAGWDFGFMEFTGKPVLIIVMEV